MSERSSYPRRPIDGKSLCLPEKPDRGTCDAAQGTADDQPAQSDEEMISAGWCRYQHGGRNGQGEGRHYTDPERVVEAPGRSPPSHA